MPRWPHLAAFDDRPARKRRHKYLAHEFRWQRTEETFRADMHDIGPQCSSDSKWAYYLGQRRSPHPTRASRRRLARDHCPELRFRTVSLSGHYAELSPDGKTFATLVALGETNPVHKIALIPLDAGPQPAIRCIDPNPDIADAPRFTPDGKALVYPITQNGVGNCLAPAARRLARPPAHKFQVRSDHADQVVAPTAKI